MYSKAIKPIVCLLLTLFIAETANAQIFKRLKDRAQEALEQSVERKVEEEVGKKIDSMAEKAVDETFDTIFGSIGSSSDGSSASNQRAGQTAENYLKRFTDTSNVTTESEYRFNIVTNLEMETINTSGESEGKMNMVFHYNDNSSYTGTQITSDELKDAGSDAIIIYDYNNEVMVMMMNTDDSKFSIAYNWTEALKDIEGQNEYSQSTENYTPSDATFTEMEESSIPGDIPDFKHLGTKNISGYSSEGYVMENEYSSTEIWVTDEIAHGMDRMFEANRSMPAVGNNLPGNYPSGMVMEMTSVEIETGNKFIMRTTEVNKNANVVFSMADYPVMSFSSDQ